MYLTRSDHRVPQYVSQSSVAFAVWVKTVYSQVAGIPLIILVLQRKEMSEETKHRKNLYLNNGLSNPKKENIGG